MDIVEKIVRKHMEAMYQDLGYVLGDEANVKWDERAYADGAEFAHVVNAAIQEHRMSSDDLVDWWEDQVIR